MLKKKYCKPKTRAMSKFSIERSVCLLSITFFSLTFLSVSVFFELLFVGTAFFSSLSIFRSSINMTVYIKFCTQKWSFKLKMYLKSL